MQRAYDMVIHDVAIQNLPVIFCLDRAGMVGDDGGTHQGAYDIAYMRCIPNMIVSAPMNEQELRNLMYTAQLEETKNPFVIRYPRGQGVMPIWETPFEKMEIGKGQKVKDGNDLAILTIGHPGNFAIKACKELAAEGIQAAHYNMRFVKPLDEEMLHEIGQKFSRIITVEDGCIQGGFGSAILEFFNEHNYKPQVTLLGVPDRVIEQAKPDEQYQECGFDAASIAATARVIMSKKENELTAY
jgi:1-deoxy-D-xylulose-5-phosphate synthase